MSKEDYASMCELAAHMKWDDAARFICGETGDGLRTAIYVCEKVAQEYPASLLAATLGQRNAA